MERRIRGTVKGGVIVLDDADIPDGTAVTVLVDSAEAVELLGPPIELDANGDVIMTPVLRTYLDEAIAASERGEGVPWDTVRAELVRKGLWKP